MTSRIFLNYARNLVRRAECSDGAVRYSKQDLSVSVSIIHSKIKNRSEHFTVSEEMNPKAEAVTAEKMTAPK